MKPTLAFVFSLACAGVVLASQTNPATYAGKRAPLLDQLVQMSRTGSSDVELLAYAKAHRRELPAEVSEQDLNFLRDSGVSERVVSYMSAVDARIPDDTQYDSVPVSPDQAAPPNGSYPYTYPQDEGGIYGNAYSNGDVGGYPYPDSYAYAYPYAYDGQCGAQWGYDCYPYFNSYYPYYPYYYYPYTFFGFSPFYPFHGHGHHFHGHNGSNGHNGWNGHGGSNGHSGSNGNQWRGQSGGTTTGRVASNDAWRQRGAGSPNASTRMPAALGQRGPSRTVVARQGIGARPGAASRGFTNRSFGPSGPGRASPGGSRMPPTSVGNRGSFSRPNFSGGVRGPGGAGHSSFSGGGMRASGGGHSSFSGGGMRASGGGGHGGGGARGGGGRH